MASSSEYARLSRKRVGYEEELESHRFLIDSYTGGGGYRGRIRQAAYTSALGNVASAYAGGEYTYLDKFSREDADKFAGRRAVASYTNYVRPTTDLKVSYIVRKMHVRTGVPQKLQDWIAETRYDEGFRRRAQIASVLGWMPITVDLPNGRGEARSLAEARAAGGTIPYITELLPLHLFDWAVDAENELIWAKTCVRTSERLTWDADPVDVDTYTIWTRKDFISYRLVAGVQEGEAIEGPHDFGRVPLVSWRSSSSIEDAVRGESITIDIAVKARTLYNLESEERENMRSSVFNILALPMGQKPTQYEGESDADYATRTTVELGSDNAITFDKDQKNVPHWLAVPAGVSDAYKNKITDTVIEMYRIARVEYDRASGSNASAQSKQQNFEQTNLAVVDIAQSLAASDLATLRLVGIALGISEDELSQMTCRAHDSYASEDLNAEIATVFEVLADGHMGTTFAVEARTRVAQRVLTALDPPTWKKIQAEIADEATKEVQEAAAMKQGLLDKAVADSEPNDDADPGAIADPSMEPV